MKIGEIKPRRKKSADLYSTRNGSKVGTLEDSNKAASKTAESCKKDKSNDQC